MKDKDSSKKEIIPYSGPNKVLTFILVFGVYAVVLVIVFISASKNTGVFPVYTDNIMTGVRIGNYKDLAENFLLTSIFVVLAVYFIIIFFKKKFERPYYKILIYTACICTIVFLPVIMLGEAFTKMEINRIPDKNILTLERKYLFSQKTEITTLEYQKDYKIHHDQYTTIRHDLPDGETLSLEESPGNRYIIYSGAHLNCKMLADYLVEITGLQYYKTNS